MKKLMIVASAALWAAVGFGDIESANVVGYATDKVEQNKFVIKAVQFEDVASGKVDANTVLSGFAGVDYGDGSTFRLTAPQLLVQAKAGGYATYYYLNDAYVEADESEKAGWADRDGNYANLALTPGTAVWVKSPGDDVDATMAGAVPADSEVAVAVPADTFTLVGGGYPVPVALNGGKMVCDGIKGVDYGDGSAFRLTAPQLLVQAQAGGYTTYYYLNDAYVEADESEKAGWADRDGNYVEPTVAVGAGFWIKSGNALTIRFAP